jgi:hypothetical protein
VLLRRRSLTYLTDLQHNHIEVESSVCVQNSHSSKLCSEEGLETSKIGGKGERLRTRVASPLINCVPSLNSLLSSRFIVEHRLLHAHYQSTVACIHQVYELTNLM